MIKREVITIKVKQKRRAQFLFNDGEFRPRSEKSVKQYRRRDKHRCKFNDEVHFY